MGVSIAILHPMSEIDGPPRLTDRLILRRWRDEDRAPFAAMNADPEVMRYFPSAMTRQESDRMIDVIEARFEEHGMAQWALERRDDRRFLGFTGLAPATFEAPFTPTIEVGWRLARFAWGHGYATEAGRAALRFGFEERHLTEILSWTARLNTPSIAVMERLGMRRDPLEDFDHPRVPDGDPLRPHVLYRIEREAWAASASDRPGGARR